MRQPIVLLPADTRAADGLTWSAVPTTYLVTLLAVAGCMPLIVPALGPALDLDAALDVADGVLITGARSNVHPSEYGAPPSPGHEPYDPLRDEVSLRLIRAALGRGLPLLCICRGVQELNVACGGTLRTDIHEEPDHADHRAPDTPIADEAFALRQTVTIRPGGLLAGIVGPGATVVNSLHRQAIATLGAGLQVEAEAEDGTIEAVSMPGIAQDIRGLRGRRAQACRSTRSRGRGLAIRASARAAVRGRCSRRACRGRARAGTRPRCRPRNAGRSWPRCRRA